MDNQVSLSINFKPNQLDVRLTSWHLLSSAPRATIKLARKNILMSALNRVEDKGSIMTQTSITSREERDYTHLRCAVFTASDTRTLDDDVSGDKIVSALEAAGHIVCTRGIIREDLDALSAQLGAALEGDQHEVVIITGGTGITRRDLTPDVINSFSTKEIPGFGELFRWLSYSQIGSSTIQSRACAHLCGETIVFGLPGSPRAVQLALDEILIPQLDIKHKPCNFPQLMPRIRG